MNDKISILFLLNKVRLNKENTCPLKCRITFNGKRKEFSTGLFVNPNHWKSRKQNASPLIKYKNLNNQLSLIRNEIYQAFLLMKSKKQEFDVIDVYSEYKGETIKKDFGVIEIYNQHSVRLKKLVGIDIQEVTYSKYLESGIHLQDFVIYNFKSKDILLKELKSNFLEEFEYFLKTVKKLQQSTINKVIQRFRRVIKYAIANDYLIKDPFMLYQAKRIKKEVVYLSVRELDKLEKTNFSDTRIQLVKELFVFCCYTGLGFKEMSNLKWSDLSEEFDGELWLIIKRKKTGRSYKVPLLPKAKDILKDFEQRENEFVFPRISNPNFNSHLKVIAKKIGITKRLTHHIARKTFATTVLLYNNVPMEIVSKLLGHSKLQTTQEHYGKIIQQRVSMEIGKLSRILDKN
ncbi:tyrosine-type recombinase/integrase [Pseudotenacibaculum haliotis]|uniref:Tyrosine-type recombinase/integrase n=1 Tax=Pseudotenacibaculum haliotis TaxID=1862138 RepID=A0ABW5LVL9_9FLAO